MVKPSKILRDTIAAILWHARRQREVDAELAAFEELERRKAAEAPVVEIAGDWVG